MDFIFKTKPYTQSTIGVQQLTISGFKVRLSDVNINLEKKLESNLLYIQLVDSEGSLIQALNLNYSQIESKLSEIVKRENGDLSEELLIKELNSFAYSFYLNLQSEEEKEVLDSVRIISEIIGLVLLPTSKQK